MALSYTHLHAKISCVHTKGKPEDKIIHTAIWNVTQDSLNLAHKCRLTFRNRWSPHCPVLFKTYTQIGFYIPVTSKTIGATKHLQKTACVQADIHMKPLRPMPAARTSNQMELFNRLGSTSFYKATLTYLDRMILPVHSCLKVSRAFQDTTINQVWLSKGYWESSFPRWYWKFWMLVYKMLEASIWECKKAIIYIKWRGDTAACIYQLGRARTKHQYKQNPTGLPSPPSWSSWVLWQKVPSFASYVFLENGFSQFDVTTDNACESTNNVILFSLRATWQYLTPVVRSMHI